MLAVNQVIASPDVVIAHCAQLLLAVEMIRLFAMLAGLGPRIYDRPRPEPLRIVIWDWATEGGWPA